MNMPINQTIDARCRQRLHDAALVGGCNDHTIFRRQQHIGTGLAQAVPNQIFQKIDSLQIGQTRHRADDFALCVTNRRRHAQHRSGQLRIHRWATDVRFRLGEGHCHIVAAQVVQTAPLCRSGLGRERHAVKSGDDHTRVKKFLKNGPLIQVGLQGRRIAQQRLIETGSDLFQCIHAVAQLVVDGSGDQFERGRLLLTQHLLHVLLRDAAGIERKRPDADQENE